MYAQSVRRFAILSCCLLFPAAVWAVDTDGDGVDDIIDVCCQTPSGVAVDAEGRPIGDFDLDCDVDTADFAEFQINLTGPMEFGCCQDNECNDNNPCTLDSCNTQSGDCVHEGNPNCQQCTIGPECQVELGCDTPATGTISNSSEVDSYCFCATPGEMVRLSVVKIPGSSSGFNPSWRLIDTNGSPTVSCGTFTTSVARVCGPLPSAGSPYHLEVIDGSNNDTGTYRVHMQRYTTGRACDETPVDCNEPVAVNIEHPLDTDLMSFTVENLDMIRVSLATLDGSGPNFNVGWRLIDGAGNAPRSCGRTSFVFGQDCGPLPAAGNPYRIEIEDANRDDTGAIEFRWARTKADRLCGGQTLDCDEPIFSAVESRSDGQDYLFRVAEGEIVRASVIELPGGGSAFTASWRLIDGFGNPFGPCGTFASTDRVLCGPLPAAGNPFAFQVEDGSLNDTGPYVINLHRLTEGQSCDEVELECGVATAASLDTVADADLFAFTPPDLETVRVSVSILPDPGAHFDPEWRLIDAAGYPAPSCGTFTIAAVADCPDLPASRAPYRVEVQDDLRNGTGSYDVRVDFLTTGCP